MKTLKILLVGFCATLLIGGHFLFWNIIIHTPKNINNSEQILFEIEQGQSFFLISENLEKNELIKNKYFFQIYAVLTAKYKNLKAGFYYLSPSMNIFEITKKLSQGKNLQIKITIPEGFTIKQIEERLISKLKTQNSKPQLKTENLKSFKDEFTFLKEIPDGATLEGFLFPDTYFFEPNIKQEEIINIFLKNFDKKINQELRQEIKNQGKTIFDIITMASLLEKEVKTIQDKKMVSGILWKRLEYSIPLQVDATIIYITEKKTTKISKQETQIDSPYNTYKYLGLPFGPICNPGIESIEAAIYPEQSNFWYYLSTPDGETIFSQTLEAHNLAKQKYLR